MAQVRGNGVLVLTKKELYFEMWMPKKILHISIRAIKEVTITKWHLKKSKGRPMLKVIFENGKKAEDAVAWLLRDVEHWKSGLEALIKAT